MKEEKKCTLSLEEEEYWLGVSWFAILRSREDDISQIIFCKFQIQGKDKYQGKLSDWVYSLSLMAPNLFVATSY